MKTILVSLVSDQTIPNILAIHHVKPDELLFITTKDMEKKQKIQAILTTLNRLKLPYEGNRSSSIIVQEDSILDCHQQLEQWIQGKEDAEFVVNLTGGTKIMSIAAYDYFIKDYNSKMLYIPIRKNHYIIPSPKKSPKKPVELALRLNLIEYVTAYGLKVTNESRLKTNHDAAAARKDASAWIAHNYEALYEILGWLCSHLGPRRGEKRTDFREEYFGMTDKVKEYFTKFGFGLDGSKVTKQLTRSDVLYFTGGWLEEFCFNELVHYKGTGVDDIVLGIELQNQKGSKNEFDVMFTKDNALYYVECKSLKQNEDKKVEVLYKIGALQKEFGLGVKSFLVSTSPHIMKNGEIKLAYKARAEQFNTTIIPPDKFIHCGKIIGEKIKTNAGG
jgi:hypothetical protein